MKPTSHDCLIGIGSNLGDRKATIRQALQELAAHPKIRLIAESTLHPTTPIGGPPDQGEFLNGAARIVTSLTAHELLDWLLAIEAKLGRTRNVHWGPRTIDLDLLLYGEQIVDEPGLQIPHPLVHERHFVLAPAAEIAPEMMHPKLRRTLGELLSSLDRSQTSA